MHVRAVKCHVGIILLSRIPLPYFGIKIVNQQKLSLITWSLPSEGLDLQGLKDICYQKEKLEQRLQVQTHRMAEEGGPNSNHNIVSPVLKVRSVL